MCKLDNPSVKEQIIENIRKSGNTPEPFIPSAESINLNDWEMECDENDKVIAQGNLESNSGDWYSCTIQKVYVDEKYRGKGIGERIVQNLIFKAKAKKNKGFDDCQILTADVDRSNEVSRNLFEKVGFKIKESFCVPGDKKKADVLRMTLAEIRNCR